MIIWKPDESTTVAEARRLRCDICVLEDNVIDSIKLRLSVNGGDC